MALNEKTARAIAWLFCGEIFQIGPDQYLVKIYGDNPDGEVITISENSVTKCNNSKSDTPDKVITLPFLIRQVGEEDDVSTTEDRPE